MTAGIRAEEEAEDATRAKLGAQAARRDAEVECDRQKRRADEYFAKIEGIVQEANEARNGYIESAAQHGNAQSMMLREREQLILQYRGLAARFEKETKSPAPKPRINDAIEQVAADFRERHIEPHAPPQLAPTTPAPSGDVSP